MPTMTLAQFADYLDAAARRLEQGVSRAFTATVVATHDRARAYSSGPFSERELRRLDHPYARRHGAPRLPAAVINVQTGDFLRSWAWNVEPRGDGFHGEVYNTDRKADWLANGTARMFARPLPEAVSAEMAPELERNLTDAVFNAFR